MNISYRQSQFELFPHSERNVSKNPKRSYRFLSLTLSLENIIILSIFSLMILILSFCLGVERGKRIAAANTTEKAEAQAVAAVTAIEEPVDLMEPPVIMKAAVVALPPENSQQGAAQEKNAYPLAKREMGYTIQVASFKKEEYARTEARNLEKRGYGAYDIRVISKGEYSIVCVGSFNEKRRAKALLSKLRSRYKDCIVRRL